MTSKSGEEAGPDSGAAAGGHNGRVEEVAEAEVVVPVEEASEVASTECDRLPKQAEDSESENTAPSSAAATTTTTTSSSSSSSSPPSSSSTTSSSSSSPSAEASPPIANATDPPENERLKSADAETKVVEEEQKTPTESSPSPTESSSTPPSEPKCTPSPSPDGSDSQNENGEEGGTDESVEDEDEEEEEEGSPDPSASAVEDNGLALAKEQGKVDEYVRLLDETNPSHRLRSLCKKGDLDGLRQLLEAKDDLGLDLDSVSEEGWTCLHEIITHECQFTEVARLLLAHGAGVNTQDLHGDSPLHSALLYHNADNISLLLDHGADLQLLNAAGRLPIHMADEPDSLALLLGHEADPNAGDQVGNTPLHYAVGAKDKARIGLILERQETVDVNRANDAGTTPLHMALDSQVSLLLLKHGADPNVSDANGNTPLHQAVRGRHKDVVRLLLEHKADVALTNALGKTPVNLAKDREMKQILAGGKAPDSASSTPTATPVLARKTKKAPAASNGATTPVMSASSSFMEQFIASTIAPEATSPSILKRKRPLDVDFADAEPDSPMAKRRGPRLRFSDVEDRRGVEQVEEEVKRVKVPPIYREPMFSSDEDL